MLLACSSAIINTATAPVIIGTLYKYGRLFVNELLGMGEILGIGKLVEESVGLPLVPVTVGLPLEPVELSRAEQGELGWGLRTILAQPAPLLTKICIEKWLSGKNV